MTQMFYFSRPEELCDEIDNDCDEIDEGVKLTFYFDDDGDDLVFLKIQWMLARNLKTMHLWKGVMIANSYAHDGCATEDCDGFDNSVMDFR